MKKSSVPAPYCPSKKACEKEHVHHGEEKRSAAVKLHGNDHHADHKDGVPASKKLESKPSIDIDRSAEEFINKFRKQLMIQRLESMENFEQMLQRGL